MISKEALEHIVNDDYNMIIATYPGQPAYNGLTKKEMAEIIEKDLEVLEAIKSKTLLLYSDRKRIAQEYEKWCKDNNAIIIDTTNMITWLLCSKLKEWLEDDK